MSILGAWPGSFFFVCWGHPKTRVFHADTPRTIRATKQRTVDEIATILANILQRVMRNFLWGIVIASSPGSKNASNALEDIL